MSLRMLLSVVLWAASSSLAMVALRTFSNATSREISEGGRDQFRSGTGQQMGAPMCDTLTPLREDAPGEGLDPPVRLRLVPHVVVAHQTLDGGGQVLLQGGLLRGLAGRGAALLARKRLVHDLVEGPQALPVRVADPCERPNNHRGVSLGRLGSAWPVGRAGLTAGKGLDQELGVRARVRRREDLGKGRAQVGSHGILERSTKKGVSFIQVIPTN